jgi:PAS domain S-box-containing protein
LLDQLPAMVGYWDAGLRNRFANAAYVNFFAVTPEQIRGIHIRDLLGPELYELNRPFMVGALSGEEQLFEREIPDPHGGPARHPQASYIPNTTDGVVRGFIALVTDITRREVAERRVRELELGQRGLLERMLRSEAEERGRIGRALHDETVQTLTALSVQLERIERLVGHDEPAAALASEARALLAETLDGTRRLIFDLRPQSFAEHGLRGAVDGLITEAAAAGLDTTVTMPGARYPGLVEELVYRTIREAVRNVYEHAAATSLDIRLTDHQAVLRGEVTDDGIGFEPQRHAWNGKGLDAARERLRLAGGELSVESRPGAGCTVRFSLPTTA